MKFMHVSHIETEHLKKGGIRVFDRVRTLLKKKSQNNGWSNKEKSSIYGIHKHVCVGGGSEAAGEQIAYSMLLMCLLLHIPQSTATINYNILQTLIFDKLTYKSSQSRGSHFWGIFAESVVTGQSRKSISNVEG